MKTSGTIKRDVSDQEAEGICCDCSDRYDIVESGKWVSFGKGEAQTIIVKDTTDGSFWSIEARRYGSPYTEYSFDYGPELTAVEQVPVTTIKWVPIMDQRGLSQ